LIRKLGPKVCHSRHKLQRHGSRPYFPSQLFYLFGCSILGQRKPWVFLDAKLQHAMLAGWGTGVVKRPAKQAQFLPIWIYSSIHGHLFCRSSFARQFTPLDALPRYRGHQLPGWQHNVTVDGESPARSHDQKPRLMHSDLARRLICLAVYRYARSVPTCSPRSIDCSELSCPHLFRNERCYITSRRHEFFPHCPWTLGKSARAYK